MKNIRSPRRKKRRINKLLSKYSLEDYQKNSFLFRNDVSDNYAIEMKDESEEDTIKI
jgi:hypothetical protein